MKSVVRLNIANITFAYLFANFLVRDPSNVMHAGVAFIFTESSPGTIFIASWRIFAVILKVEWITS